MLSLVGRSWATRWCLGAVLAACAPLPSALDATSAADATEEARSVGAPCAPLPPACGAGLECQQGRCARVPQRCLASGVFYAPNAVADFDDAPTPACRAVPWQLVQSTFLLRYAAPTEGAGRLDCVGLAPGAHTVNLRARVRLTAPAGATPAYCTCTAQRHVELTLVQEETGEAWPLRFDDDAPTQDGSCRGGPDFALALPVAVGPSGTLSLRADLARCQRGGDGAQCLFLAGSSAALAPE